jgi:hypothetical protein
MLRLFLADSFSFAVGLNSDSNSGYGSVVSEGLTTPVAAKSVFTLPEPRFAPFDCKQHPLFSADW